MYAISIVTSTRHSEARPRLSTHFDLQAQEMGPVLLGTWYLVPLAASISRYSQTTSLIFLVVDGKYW